MKLTLRTLLSIAFVAFIVGFAPTIYSYISENLIYTIGQGFSLHPRVWSAVASVFAFLRTYAWHIVAIYALVIAFVIFLENQNPDRTILWMLTLLLLPGLGLLVYMIIGPDFHNLKIRKRFRSPKVQNIVHADLSQDKRYLLGRLLHACGGAELMWNNEVEVFTDGREKFDALIRDIENAKRYVHIQYFIIKADKIGAEIGDALAAAAGRGVRVFLLYDAVGSWKLDRKYVERLKAAGVECHSFMPLAMPRFRRKMNFRNHRKIVVIDDAVAYTGGFNIGDEYLGQGHLGYWRDTHLRIRGDTVAALHKIFISDWCFRADDDSGRMAEELRKELCETVSEQAFSDLPVLPMQVVSSGVDSVWHSIAQGYFSMITRARDRVWITSPYLVPGPNLLSAMANAALSGVDVRVLIPSTRDHFLVFWASRGAIEPLLRAGVRVFLYKKGFIHAKTLLSDSDTTAVGTCNMDIRSLEINFENQVFIYDKEINARFAADFEKDLEEAEEILLAQWEQRPLWQKILESFGRLYSAQI